MSILSKKTQCDCVKNQDKLPTNILSISKPKGEKFKIELDAFTIDKFIESNFPGVIFRGDFLPDGKIDKHGRINGVSANSEEILVCLNDNVDEKTKDKILELIEKEL